MNIECSILSVILAVIRFTSAFYAFSIVRLHLKVSVVLSLSLGLALYSIFFLDFHMKDSQFGPAEVIVLSLAEMIRGFILSCPFVIAIEVFPYSTRIIELARGAQFAEQQFPGIEGRTCLLEAIMYNFGVLMLWFCFMPQFLKILVNCNIGDDIGYDSNFVSIKHHLITLVKQYSSVLQSGFKTVSPYIFGCFCIDIGVGLVSRFSERLSVSNDAISVKLLFGLICLVLYIKTAIPGSYFQLLDI